MSVSSSRDHHLSFLPNELLHRILYPVSGQDILSLIHTSRSLRNRILPKCTAELCEKPRCRWDVVKITIREDGSCELSRMDFNWDGPTLAQKYRHRDTFQFSCMDDLLFALAPFVLQTSVLSLDIEHYSSEICDALSEFAKVSELRPNFSLFVHLRYDVVKSDWNLLTELWNQWSPVELHLCGGFDRSLLTDESLPNKLRTLVICAHPCEELNMTKLTGKTLLNIVKLWESAVERDSIPPTYEIVGDEDAKDFIRLPHCDMSADEYFEIVRGLTSTHSASESIIVDRVPLGRYEEFGEMIKQIHSGQLNEIWERFYRFHIRHQCPYSFAAFGHGATCAQAAKTTDTIEDDLLSVSESDQDGSQICKSESTYDEDSGVTVDDASSSSSYSLDDGESEEMKKDGC